MTPGRGQAGFKGLGVMGRGNVPREVRARRYMRPGLSFVGIFVVAEGLNSRLRKAFGSETGCDLEGVMDVAGERKKSVQFGFLSRSRVYSRPKGGGSSVW